MSFLVCKLIIQLHTHNKKKSLQKWMGAILMTCADPESFVRGVSALTYFFFFFCLIFTIFVIYFRGGLVDDRRGDPNSTQKGPGPLMAQQMLAW